VKVDWVRAGAVLELVRRPVDVELESMYQEIGVRSFGRGLFHKEPVSGSELGSKRVFKIRSGDLIISNVFAWEGAIAVATSDDDDLIGSHRFMTWTPKVSDVAVDYLREYFLSDHGLADIIRASPGSAGRNKTLGIKAFEDIRVPIPSLPTQANIAKRLAMSSLDTDETIANSMCAIRNQLLGHRAPSIRFQIRDFLRQDTRATRVVAAEHYPNVGLLNRGRGIFEKAGLAGNETKYAHLYRISKNQLIYSKLFGWEGAVAVVSNEFDGYFVSAEFPHFDVDCDLVRPAYLRHLAKTSTFQRQLQAASTGMGQRRQRVNVDRFLAVEVPLPPTRTQDRIIDHLDRVERVEALSTERRRLAAALPKATRNDMFAKLIR